MTMDEDFSDEVERWLQDRTDPPLSLQELMVQYASDDQGRNYDEFLKTVFERSVSNYICLMLSDAQDFLETAAKSVDPDSTLRRGMEFASGFLKGAAGEMKDVVDGIIPFTYFIEMEDEE